MSHSPLVRLVALLCALCVIALMVSLGSFFAVRAPSRPGPVVTMIVPGPVITVERQTYRDRVPGVFAPNSLGFPKVLPPARVSELTPVRCDAECAAYAKAYRNAHRANQLLGEQRYREHA
jgi:hypothetical protein